MTPLRSAVFVLLAVLGASEVAVARIVIRPTAPSQTFSFHAQPFTQPFLPGDAFGLQIWSCANGEMPAFVADLEPRILCIPGGQTTYTTATLVYEVEVPAGLCEDRGRSCYYRDTAARPENGGLRYFRVQYARRSHGNRIWLDSYGDLSGVDQARVLVVVKINGSPRAVREVTFTPLRRGGWFSK